MDDPAAFYELVVVSYYSHRPLSRLLDAVDGVPVVVVDNASDADGVRALTSAHSHVRYLDAGSNLGFAAAANLGLAASDAEIVIFINPDCIPTLPVLEALAQTLHRHRDVAACSPALRSAGGRISAYAGGSTPTLGRSFAHAIGAHVLWRRSGIWRAPRPGEVLDVEWLAGTCLAVRRSAFQAVGGFDERYFLYSEDMALGDRFRQAAMRQLLRGDIAVEHSGGGSSDVALVDLWLLRAGSFGRFITDHHGAAASSVMRATLGTGFLLRAGLFTVIPGRHYRRREMLTYVKGMLRPDRATAAAMASLSARLPAASPPAP